MKMRRFARVALGLGLLAVGLVAQQFEVASIKPNNEPTRSMHVQLPSGGKFAAKNVTLKTLISFAYKAQGFFDIEGGPAWLDSAKYDLEAKAGRTDLTTAQYWLMLQALLADRFQLRVHTSSKETPGYQMLAAKSGPKLKPSNAGSCAEYLPNAPTPEKTSSGDAPIPCGGFNTGQMSMDGRGMSMTQLANTLTILLGRPTVDGTQLPGRFDIHLEFSAEGIAPGALAAMGADQTAAGVDDRRPSIFTAVEQELGLTLKSQKQTVPVLVIDHAEKASAN